MWWDDAIWDNCSLITLDKALLDHPDLQARFFKRMTTIDVVLTDDNMRPETRSRVEPRISKRYELPSAVEIIRLTSGLSKKLSQVDALIYATACTHRVPIVTGDSRLARVYEGKSLARVGSFAGILKQLVEETSLTVDECNGILYDLEMRNEHILRELPQTWDILKDYQFP